MQSFIKHQKRYYAFNIQQHPREKAIVMKSNISKKMLALWRLKLCTHFAIFVIGMDIKRILQSKFKFTEKLNPKKYKDETGKCP